MVGGLNEGERGGRWGPTIKALVLVVLFGMKTEDPAHMLPLNESDA